MKKILLFLQVLLVMSSFSSCIQDEPLNAECDIIAVDSLWLEQQMDIIVGKPIVTNDLVSFNIKRDADRTHLNPRFVLTDGARITMTLDGQELEANGVMRDFTSPQTYTVHSEDGKWHKDYKVSFNYPTTPTTTQLLDFEHFELDATGRYHQWYEIDPTDATNPRRSYWASGNSAYAITGMGKKYDDYPTVSDPMGVKGNCVKLTTCRTGSFGDVVKMPIAAGNLFIGTFDTKIAMSQPRKATGFGLQLVGGKPLKLTGYYKYKAGEVFTDKNKQVCPERHDTADIYAVIYEVDPSNFVPLNGDDVLSSDRIVMMARIDSPGEPAEWTHFEEPFRLMPGKQFDKQRMSNDGYAITVVCTSSRQGAYFEGAVGSTLYVDELRILWEIETDGK